jgi:hypothetical protein
VKKAWIAVGLMLCMTPGIGFAADATSAWKKVLKKCAKSDFIKKQTLFFGLSNTIGPGSVWRFADDKSIRLLFDLADALPNQADRDQVLQLSNIGDCSGDSTSNWNLKLGLPISTGTTPLALDIAAALKRASKVTVSVTGFSVDLLKEVPWEEKVQALGPDSPYVKRLHASDGIVASNVLKVAGLKAVFVFGTSLSADVEAKFQDKTFVLGEGEDATGGAGSGAAGEPSPGGATLHADVTTANTITVTSEGPFYMIAAYSRVQGGAPTGLAAPFVLKPVNVAGASPAGP